MKQIIREHIEAIQREILEKYGLIAKVGIDIYSTRSKNQRITQEEAIDCICNIQPAFNGDIEISRGGTFRWVKCENWAMQKGIVVFFK